MTVPAIDLTGFDLSRLDLRDVGVPGADRIAGIVRDSAYVGVGFFVLGVQRARWERRQLEKRLRRAAGLVGG